MKVAEQEVPELHHQGIMPSQTEVQVEVKVDHRSHKELRQKRGNGMIFSNYNHIRKENL